MVANNMNALVLELFHPSCLQQILILHGTGIKMICYRMHIR